MNDGPLYLYQSQHSEQVDRSARINPSADSACGETEKKVPTISPVGNILTLLLTNYHSD